MTILLSCRKIMKEFGENIILKNINFDIALGDRIGLVGINGAGKSTLANIIYGDVQADQGGILWYKKDINLGYLYQSAQYSQRKWSGEYLSNENEGYLKYFEELSSHLGISHIDTLDGERIGSLSGGEKMKLALANIWSKNPDFIILDEPTNHLDYSGVSWLIEELKQYKGTILIISHDRYFLDKTVNKIVEINIGESQTYYGNYSFYKEEKKRRFESQLHEFEMQEAQKAKIQEEITQLKNWSDKAHRDSRKKEVAGLGKKEYFRVKAKKKDKQIKSKIKRLEKIDLEGIKKPEEDKKINFMFNEARLKGNRIIEAKEISKSFNNKVLFKNSSFYIKRGERIGLFGANGCGKTTLLKILLDEVSLDEGEIFISNSISVGYLSQEALDMDKELRIMDVFEVNSREEQGKVRTLLANMGFDEKMVYQRLNTLSLGEITRVRMTKLIIKQNDLLILDEPLNHLDIYSREKLEEALKDYHGTIILVSHDRYMIQNICEGILAFEGNKIMRITESPKEYLDNLENKRLNKEQRTNQSSINEKDIKEQRMLIENELAYILGELSKFNPGTSQYEELDKRFNELIIKKGKL